MDYMVYEVYGKETLGEEQYCLRAQFDTREDVEVFIEAVKDKSHFNFKILDNREE